MVGHAGRPIPIRIAHADLTLNWFKVKVKVIDLLNFRKLHFSASISSAILAWSSKRMVDYDGMGPRLYPIGARFLNFSHMTSNFAKCWYHQNPLGFISSMPEKIAFWLWLQELTTTSCARWRRWPSAPFPLKCARFNALYFRHKRPEQLGPMARICSRTSWKCTSAICCTENARLHKVTESMYRLLHSKSDDICKQCEIGLCRRRYYRWLPRSVHDLLNSVILDEQCSRWQNFGFMLSVRMDIPGRHIFDSCVAESLGLNVMILDLL